jgi:hypothetical protein
MNDSGGLQGKVFQFSAFQFSSFASFASAAADATLAFPILTIQ